MSNRGRAVSLWLPPLAVMAAIFVLSSMPSADVDRSALEVGLRKLGHFAEFALLAALLWRALVARLDAARAVAAAFAVTVGYAVADEIHQSFVDGRIASTLDVFIDAAGAATVLALVARRRAGSRA